ncbi:MAG TPA: hypothetical protein VK179_13525 [Bacteroidales bacterium]|nr:hypothetical protein [Bacteroidales bacterium]
MRILLGVMVMMISSCNMYMNVTKREDFKKYEDRRYARVILLETLKSDTVYFSEQFPGIMANEKVTGIRQSLLQNFNPDSIIFLKHESRPVIDYIMKDGIKYAAIVENNRTLVFNPTEMTEVPFTDINMMYIRNSKPYLSNIILVTTAGATLGLALWVINGMNDALNMKP